ncbi:MAG: hypothetical protein HUK21_05220 [Fibrobacteraceae bacterium]|nr:hypothetical protein [Fibrobacteraceae bacterium]
MKFLFLILLMVSCCFATVLQMAPLVDTRDNKTYKTVQIGTQRWMAENLNYKSRYRLCYGNQEDNCTLYGSLYKWFDALRVRQKFERKSAKKVMTSKQGICPKGWHIPSKSDWEILRKYVRNKSWGDGPGFSLKSTDGWRSDNGRQYGTDEFGFNALPGGAYYYTGFHRAEFTFKNLDGFTFNDDGLHAYFWTSTEYEGDGAYYFTISYDNSRAELMYESKESALSVRCLCDTLYEIQLPKVVEKKEEEKKQKVEEEKPYKTVVIGNQVWYKENLRINAPGSFCYQNNEENCKKYGRLYTWDGAYGLCPSGSHLPNNNEWQTLLEYLKKMDSSPVGKNLKAREAWQQSINGAGSDLFGFMALPGGAMEDSLHFTGIDYYAGFWSRSIVDTNEAYVYSLHGDDDSSIFSKSSKMWGHSVRCIMDPPDELELAELNDSTTLIDFRDGRFYKVAFIGGKHWMAENLDYKVDSSYCYLDDNRYCKKFGRLYSYSVANDSAKKLCPEGWHIPSNKEWALLGSNSSLLKANEIWALGAKKGNPIQADSLGFKALPAGAKYGDGEYAEVGGSAYFWASEGSEENGFSYWTIVYGTEDFVEAQDFENDYFSVRCVKD